MKYVSLAFAFLAVLFCAVVALGQTPPPQPKPYDHYSLSNFGVKPRPVCAWYEFWCSDSVYRNPNLSPVTKRKLWEQDPTVCHTDECRRLRLAAGIEYMGLDPLPQPRRRVVPPAPVYTPPKPRGYGGFYIYCRSTNSVITRDECPDK